MTLARTFTDWIWAAMGDDRLSEGVSTYRDVQILVENMAALELAPANHEQQVESPPAPARAQESDRG